MVPSPDVAEFASLTAKNESPEDARSSTSARESLTASQTESTKESDDSLEQVVEWVFWEDSMEGCSWMLIEPVD